MARTFASNSAIIALAASRLSALAAIRRWTPSCLAYVARVGFSLLIRDWTSSATFDSPIPTVLRVRVTSTPPPPMSRRGAACSSHIFFISCGTPGMQMILLPLCSTHQPGAVPIGLSIAVADGISVACLMFMAGIGRLRRAYQPASNVFKLRADCHRLAKCRRDRLAGQVVLGRAEATSHDDHVGAPQRPLDGL